MPYICLARNDVPDGAVQVLDLRPNTSQPKPPSAQGQTKYINRTIRGDALSVTGGAAFSPTAAGYLSNTTNTVTTTEAISGLTAYIMDAVQPCNAAASTARIRVVVNPAAADTISFVTDAGTYTLTAVAGLPAADQFQVGGGAAATATNITAALNDPGNQANCVTAIGFQFTAAAVGVNVDITTSVTGFASTAALATSVPAKISFLFGGATPGATYNTTRTRRTAEAWNVNTINLVTAAIQAAVDGGSAMTTTALATLLAPTVGTTAVTAANPAVFTTASAHGLTTGDSVFITGCAGGGAASVNSKNWIVTVASTTTFSIDFDNSVAGVTAAAATVAYAPSTNVTGTGQLLVLADLLKILSGQGYSLPTSTVLYSTDALGGSGVNAQKFHTALAGTTTFLDTSVGPQVPPTTIPITVTLPIKPIRPTFGGAAFNLSITQGVLQQLAAGPTWNLNTRSFMNGDAGLSGRALTSAGAPIRSYAYQGNRANLKQGFADANPGALTSLSGIRLVTVYDDSGNVLV